MNTTTNTYDIIIPVASKDISFLPRVVHYIRLNLHEADKIYIITSGKNIRNAKVLKTLKSCVILDEDELVEGLSFAVVRDLLLKLAPNVSVGWFFQQFLKIAFGTTPYATKYYLSWDADTLPLKHIPFFEGEHPLFSRKYEYNQNYFTTINKLLGLNKLADFSFIAEHMLFNPDIIKNLIIEIEKSDIQGVRWYEKIINAGDYSINLQTFSEFETYGTFVLQNYPDLYKTRQLNTFRCGGFIQGRNITDGKLKTISFDCDTISFEYGHDPLFPYNLYCHWQLYWQTVVVLKKYSIKDLILRLLKIR